MGHVVDIDKAARLARLELSEGEKPKLKKQFAEMIEFFNKISELDTEGVEPLVTPTEMKAVLREDEVLVDNSTLESVLEQAPEIQGRFFKVPPVV